MVLELIDRLCSVDAKPMVPNNVDLNLRTWHDAPACSLELMDCRQFSPHGRTGQGYPSSRDWALPDLPCGAKTCVANRLGKCIAPACCVIGEDGRCEGFTPRGRGSDEVGKTA